MKQYILRSISGTVAEGEMWRTLRDYVEDDDPILYLRLVEYMAGNNSSEARTVEATAGAKDSY